ncbi:MAG TPA: antibiotic biosynthesis monooxygenase [Candidatus Baltobacteraceae bacterium]|jgi:heme-degrading monooxygenase HmoA|nr:antibiotic biosynthesis monooxygenase [Candidatus Baltobacteraceae bacterium]
MHNKERIVAVITFQIKPEDFETAARDASLVMERRLPTLPGFIEGSLLTNKTKTQLLSVTQWESRHSWAAAQWDEDVARVVAELFSGMASYDIEFFYPLVKVHSDAVH